MKATHARRTIGSVASEPEARVRVMLVDDHDVVRSGLRSVLESTRRIDVVAEAATASEAVDEAERVRPDVVLMDVRLPDRSGVEATREIRALLPETKVVMLTSFADDEAYIASMMAGAVGYLLKEVRGGDIVGSVLTVAAGERLVDDDSARDILDRVHKGKHLVDDRLALLSPQEERILEQITLGRTNSEIAAILGLAEKTVKNYVSNVLMKLEVARRAEAAAYLARHSGSRG